MVLIETISLAMVLRVQFSRAMVQKEKSQGGHSSYPKIDQGSYKDLFFGNGSDRNKLFGHGSDRNKLYGHGSDRKPTHQPWFLYGPLLWSAMVLIETNSLTMVFI